MTVVKRPVCQKCVSDCLYVKRMKRNLKSNISNTRDNVSSRYPNTEKRVENTTRSGVVLTKLDLNSRGLDSR